MNALNFTYDGVSSEDMGIIMCSYDGDSEITTVGSKVEFSTAKSPNSYKWLKTNATYTEQLTFTFSLGKNPCMINDEEMYFSSEDQAAIIRWLVRKEYHYLCFYDTDSFQNIYYNCFMTLEKKQIAGKTIGFTATVTCDAPFGWSEERTATVTTDINKVFDTSQEIGYIIPNTVITALSDGDVKVYNDNTNETTVIKNCKANEQITLTDMMRISSSIEHKNLYDDFGDWVFPKIQNSYNNNVNTFELTNCKLNIKWREIRKAVI